MQKEKIIMIIGIVLILIGTIGIIFSYHCYSQEAQRERNYGNKETYCYENNKINITARGIINSTDSFHSSLFTRYVLYFNETRVIRVIYGVEINISAVGIEPTIKMLFTVYFTSGSIEKLLTTKEKTITLSKKGSIYNAIQVVELVNMHKDTFVSLIWGNYDTSWNNTLGEFYCIIDITVTGAYSGETTVITTDPMGIVSIEIYWKKEGLWFGTMFTGENRVVASAFIIIIGIIIITEAIDIAKEKGELFIRL